MKRKFNPSPGNNSDGLWKAFKLNKNSPFIQPKKVLFADEKVRKTIDFTGFMTFFMV